jgi:ArsR family transcriptional regulator
MPDRLLDTLKALADESRLRILRGLSLAELSVAELVAVLDLPQSTVSRHLKPLRDQGLVETRRDGTSVFYRKGPAFADPSLAALLDPRFAQVEHAVRDRAAVRRVLDQRRRRSRDFFDRMAGRYDALIEPGGGWMALATALSLGFAGREVADLGAGEGALTLLLARFARRVTAVDQSPRMLGLIEERAAAAGLDGRIAFAQADLESLPLPDASQDACFLSQALHHAAQPQRALREAARVLRPGGHLLLLDLVRHEQEWVREQFADQWLGFDPPELRAWFLACGLRPLREESIAGSSPELPVLFMVGERETASRTAPSALPSPTRKGKKP